MTKLRPAQHLWIAVIAQLAAAVLMYGVAMKIAGPQSLATFWRSTWIPWSAISGALLAAAITFFSIVVSLLKSDAGEFVANAGASAPYLVSCGMSGLFSFTATGLFVVSGALGGEILAHSAGICLFLSVLSLWSMFKNTYDLVRIHFKFERERRGFGEEKVD